MLPADAPAPGSAIQRLTGMTIDPHTAQLLELVELYVQQGLQRAHRARDAPSVRDEWAAAQAELAALQAAIDAVATPPADPPPT